ncbi:MAG: hypothetical protein GXO83_05285 [Chlorobi bacterium]|nr:hypothetical protein [Chlorobiota bacterium]
MIIHRYFRYLLIGGLFVSTIQAGVAQKKVINDLGLAAGGAWYFGDLNPAVMFYSPSPAVGIFYRPNINKRYAVRTSFWFGGLRSNGNAFGDPLPPFNTASFQHSFIDLSVQFEFNFLPYSPHPRKVMYSPYVSAGAGYAMIFGATPAGQFVLPFGLGFKLNISERIDGGVEWGFRKTFNDMIDGSQNLIAPNDNSLLHNNDWYSIVGIFVSYKIFYNREKCAAYW